MSKNSWIYNPVPEDTSGVVLPADVMAMCEEMAENAHEIWSVMRMEQGWTYGPVLDDEKKEHPCLVPYSELPEEQKEFDRRSAMETLKLIVKLGYDLKKN